MSVGFDNSAMSEIAEPDAGPGWSPAPDVGQAGTVMTKDGQWAYRYKDGAELIMMKMPERPASM
ncbi:hypothetical protein ABH939_005891 [Rhodococcus sp. 27YEA6]